MTSITAFALLLALGQAQGPAVPLTETEAVKAAIANSPKLRAARFEMVAALAQLDKERPVARPTVKAEAQGTLQGPRVTFPRPGAPDATFLPEEYAQAQLIVEQLLYRRGASAAKTRYAAQVSAAFLQYQQARNDLALEVRKAYYNLLAARESDGVAREGVTMASKHLDLTKVMLAAGTAMERDVKAADADLAEAELGLSRARNGQSLALANLNRLLGRDPATPIDIPRPAVQPAVPEKPDAGVQAALNRRPELKLLESQIKAAQAGVILARSQEGPSLSIRGIASAQTPTAFMKSDYFAGSLVLSWNPFDGGKAKSDAKEAKARASQLEALLEEARLGIRVDVQKAWTDMREAADRIRTADRQMAAAESAADVSRLRFEVRQATQLEVSNALLNVTKARMNRAQAVLDLNTAAADYAHATGQSLPEEAVR